MFDNTVVSEQIIPEWAPLGANRFLDLVKDNFFTNIALFRCVERFLCQFGISTNPDKNHWHNDQIPDDPNTGNPISKHVVSFAGSGDNSRSTHIFIALENLDFLGKSPWEVPFGRVASDPESDATIRAWYKGYGDSAPEGKGPQQHKIHNRGEEYLHEFPLMDYITECKLVELKDLENGRLRGFADFEANKIPPVVGSQRSASNTGEHVPIRAPELISPPPVLDAAAAAEETDAEVPSLEKERPFVYRSKKTVSYEEHIYWRNTKIYMILGMFTFIFVVACASFSMRKRRATSGKHN